MNVTPVGRVPVLVIVGAGCPPAVIAKLKAVPVSAVAEAPLVNTGG